MSDLKQINNHNLYKAAQKNNLADVLQYLNNGAEVVDIKKNRGGTDESVFHTYGFDENINLSSALHYALKHRNIEMVARLAKSAQKNGVIDDALYQYAAYLDKNVASILYVQALNNPDDVLNQLAKKRLAEQFGMMKNTSLGRGKVRSEKSSPFKLYDLTDILFLNSNGGEAGMELNAAIAQAYLRARELYDSASAWSYGKKDKARKIVDQLVYLHSLYKHEEQLPEVLAYFAESSSGQSLVELLQSKRVPNPFVMFSRSWSEVQGKLPLLGKLEENVVQKLRIIF
jgi:hypothetical protein